jgi:hypothetical protein
MRPRPSGQCQRSGVDVDVIAPVIVAALVNGNDAVILIVPSIRRGRRATGPRLRPCG